LAEGEVPECRWRLAELLQEKCSATTPASGHGIPTLSSVLLVVSMPQGGGTAASPILHQQEPGGPKHLFCAPLKNGNTWWLNLFCYAKGGSENVCASDLKWNKKDAIVDRLFRDHGRNFIQQIREDKNVSKYMLVRNPLTRVLAAWLTWVGRSESGHRVEDNASSAVAARLGDLLTTGL